MSVIDDLTVLYGAAVTTAETVGFKDRSALRVTTGGAISTTKDGPVIAAVGDYVVDGHLVKASDALSFFQQPLLGKTTVVSLLSTASVVLDLPAIAGTRPIVTFAAFVVTGRTGTATGSLVWQVGNNSPNFDNVIAQKTTPAAPFNATTFSLPFSLPVTIDPTSGGMPDMAIPLQLRISTALTGANVLQGRFGMDALYV